MIYYKGKDKHHKINFTVDVVQTSASGTALQMEIYPKEVYIRCNKPLINSLRYIHGKDMVIKKLNEANVEIYNVIKKRWETWNEAIMFRPSAATPYIYDIASGKEFLNSFDPVRITKSECDLHIAYH